MKHAAKLPSRGSASSSSSSPPTAHRLSHAIAKAPPRKIRIIHVLAPEVIKTEARHFRELVQRLTGKPAPNGSYASSSTTGGDASPPPASGSSCDEAGGPGAGAAAAIDEVKVKVKEEAEVSSSGEEGGGFLRALELDGYDEPFFRGLEDFLMEREPAGFDF